MLRLSDMHCFSWLAKYLKTSGGPDHVFFRATDFLAVDKTGMADGVNGTCEQWRRQSICDKEEELF